MTPADPHPEVANAVRDALAALDPASRRLVTAFAQHPVPVADLPHDLQRAATGQTLNVDAFLRMLHPSDGFRDLRAIHSQEDAIRK